MFQLTAKEKQKVVAICDHLSRLKFSPALPYAFTEHGPIMLASILNTGRAIEVSVFVVRAFIKLREMLMTHKDLAYKLAELERRLETHDETIQSLVSAIRQLMAPREGQEKKIGFHLKKNERSIGAGDGIGMYCLCLKSRSWRDAPRGWKRLLE